jgi:hypothetical protein
VTEEPQVDELRAEPCPDLEYDLAHGVDVAAAAEAAAREGQASAVLMPPVTQTVGYDSDYGYDLAHDLPRE